MTKTMIRLNNNIVVNIESHPITRPETDDLLYTADRPVGIGDIYKNGKFYRDGKEILTPLEEATKLIDEYKTKEEELYESYTEGVNSI